MNRPGNSVWGDRQAKERRRTDKPQRSTSHSMAHQTSASAEAWPAADCRCLDIRRHVARAPFFASQRLLSRGLDPPKRSTPKDAPLSEHLDTGSCHGRGLGGACRSTAVSGTSRDHAGYAMGAPCNARRHCWRAILQKRHGGASIGAPAAVQNPAKAPPGTTAAAPTEDRNPSTIPTPVDNPWALGLLAALAVVMLWMDWSQRRDRV